MSATLHSSPVLLGTAHTNSSGSFVKTFTIPASVTLGIRQVILTGVNSAGDPASTTLSLTLSSLPTTGSSATMPLTLLGVSLLLAGCACAMALRRKRLL